jgi:hypothetical protein
MYGPQYQLLGLMLLGAKLWGEWAALPFKMGAALQRRAMPEGTRDAAGQSL